MSTSPRALLSSSSHNVPRKQSAQSVRFVTFNVCGIKNVLNYTPWNENKSFEHMFSVLDADVICLQETKIQPKDLTESMAKVKGYNAFFSFPSRKKGYSGVVIYVKDTIGVVKAEQGITGWLNSDDCKGTPYRLIDSSDEFKIGAYPGIDKKTGLEVDAEGRAVVLDLGCCVVIGLYCPANSINEERDVYRRAFFETLDTRVRKLVEEENRSVVLLGDLNIAKDLIDSADGRQEWTKEGIVQAAQDGDTFVRLNAAAMKQWRSSNYYRQMLNDWVDESDDRSSPAIMRDTTRSKFPTRLAMYTCWNVKLGARAGNVGSRIDYVLTTPGVECEQADILAHLLGSDHCPVYADLRLATREQEKLPRLCAKYIARFHNNQTLTSILGRQRQDIVYGIPSVSEKRGQNLSISESRKKQATKSPALSTFSKARSLPKDDSKQTSLLSFYERNENSEAVVPDVTCPAIQESALSNITMLPRRASSDEWKQIFKAPEPPKCNIHHEPCKLLMTKKRGINYGRSFWVCSRPLGIEADASAQHYKCNYFKWAS